VHTVQAIRGAALTPREAREAAIVGWCLEWLQAFFLVADDLMDGSPTRRGQPCWYKLPAVGNIAINDSIMLQSHIFLFLRKFLRGHPA
jgi:farnesyl diphosphate synthase